MPQPTPPAALLRQEVGLLRRRERRRVFDPVLCVGRLGGERARFVLRAQHQPVLDRGLRVEVVCRLVEQAPEAAVGWLERPGVPEVGDADLAWLAATGAGFGVHGRVLEGFYAITRTGWLDVTTGERRTWKRLRL